MARNKKGIETAEIIQDKCIACQICIGECPVGAIELTGEGVAGIDPEVCIGCGKCFDVCPVGAVKFEKKRIKKPPKTLKDTPAYKTDSYRGVAVFIEVLDGSPAPVSLELIGRAVELAEKRKCRVTGLLLGSGVESAARESLFYGCDEIHMVDHPELEYYLSHPYGITLANLCKELEPEILLIGATHPGRDLAAVVATKLNTGLTADCTELDIEEETGLLLMTRPTFGGNIMATIFCENRRPQMSTVRPQVMRMPERKGNEKGRVISHEYISTGPALAEFISFMPAAENAGAVDIREYPVLVSAGKGACGPDAFPLLQELADTLGGTLACSRPVVEAGLMPYERQVGQTGKSVAPKLYIAVGVSGAIQHLAGIQGAEKILAINRDRHSPIFQVADAGIVGDYREIIPLLIEQIKTKIRLQEHTPA